MTKKNNGTIDVIIPVYKPDKKLDRLLHMIQIQEQKIQTIILMNTDQSYWPEGRYDKIPNLQVHHLDKSEFDHGGTRNRGAQYSNADFIIFMTDDAEPQDSCLIGNLVKPLIDSGQDKVPVAISYARQIPREDCQTLEIFTRMFNYPEESRLKTEADIETLGIKTYFASNVCCAYNRKIYQNLGGFITHTIFNEDMIFAAKAVSEGYGIYYAADARVIHSHNYSPIQQFRRNFDLAVSQADHPEIFLSVSSEKEGLRLVKKTVVWLADQKKPYMIPWMFIVTGCKYMGYLMGRNYKKLPGWVVLGCSMNPEYWKHGTERKADKG